MEGVMSSLPDPLPPSPFAHWIAARLHVLAVLVRQRVLANHRLVRVTRKTQVLGNVKIDIVDSKPDTHGPDDQLYEKSFAKPPSKYNVWEGQARGQTEVRINDRHVMLLMGLRKFGYEEDPYRTHMSPHEEIVSETYTRKENGECFHLAGFEWNNQFYYVGGSKNVHGVVRGGSSMPNDIALYNDTRYEFFRELMTQWSAIENRISPLQRKLLRRYLATTGQTFGGESCTLEHQHLVEYKSDQLFFFSASSPAHSRFGLTALLPDHARDLFITFGIGHIQDQFTVGINDEAHTNIRNKFRLENNSEGAVVYVVSRNSISNRLRVCRVYKYKNEDYVFRRAIREQMRSRADSAKVRARIRRLHFRHTRHEAMLQAGLQFNAWCRMRESRGDFKWEWLFSHWVSVERDFEHVTAADRAQALYQFDKQAAVCPADVGVVSNKLASSQLHLFAMGPPGTGKSTVWRVLERMFEGWRRVNQDDFGGKAGPYHAEIKRLSSNSSVKAILLDKCNHNTHIRSNACEALASQGKLVYVMFLHPDDASNEAPSKTVSLAHKRIYGRGMAHLTLFPDVKLGGILSGFAESWEGLTGREKQSAAAVIRVDITLPLPGVVQTVLDGLRDQNLLPPPSTDEESQIESAIQAVLNQEQELAEPSQLPLRV
eukprot:c8504_g1_i1.p1 GENE.c8504_g1_i1~~c8504_g1_i1.p1  ORF type:complete len:691 (+),score=162.47 c8504_g1_i1:106-2073(+)